MRAWLGMLAVAGATACGDSTFEPPDCSGSVGQYFIEVKPDWQGYYPSYGVNVRDSIQLSASLRRIDAAQAGFNPQAGWTCHATVSSPVTATVAFTTTNTDVVRIGTAGWIHGVQQGSAIVTAASAQPAATTDIDIVVHGP